MSHVAVIRADMGISLLKADSKGEKKLKKKKNTSQTVMEAKSLFTYMQKLLSC